MEARKAAGVEEARRKVEEEERRRVEEVERLEGKVRSLDSENRELRRKNMEAIAANADLQARYQQIVAEKARLERLGRRLKWKCNFCGNLHDDPTECARPGLGGQWVDA
jgi:predicted RNase H-like nuclease (RuvC/YqgF family)